MLNPTGFGSSPKMKELQERTLDENFNSGSPYFGMYTCGLCGVPLEDCLSKCARNGIAVRKKDIENYNNGMFKREISLFGHSEAAEKLSRSVTETGIPADEARLVDFPLIPQSMLGGNKRRFFPCTDTNRPMQKWGYTRDYTPELYTQADAKALSPVHWIGQNMYMQPFVVVDIDGRGHGEEDADTIAFGRMFENQTMKMEDPAKPGSFHLYFSTNRLIPVRHWAWAKIDFMGNAVNAAVYLKNKRSNNLPMMELTEEIWQLIQNYQKSRKEPKNVS